MKMKQYHISLRIETVSCCNVSTAKPLQNSFQYLESSHLLAPIIIISDILPFFQDLGALIFFRWVIFPFLFFLFLFYHYSKMIQTKCLYYHFFLFPIHPCSLHDDFIYPSYSHQSLKWQVSVSSLKDQYRRTHLTWHWHVGKKR